MKKILIVQSRQCLSRTLVSQITSVIGLDVDVAETLHDAKMLMLENSYILMLVDFEVEKHQQIETFLAQVQLPAFIMVEKESKDFKLKFNRSLVIDYVVKESPEVVTYLVKSIHRIYQNRSTKVLVVDDSDSDRAYMVKMAQNQLYQVCEAKDGQEALEMLEEDKQIKIIVADIHMPKMDGVTLLKYIREKKLQNEVAVLGVSSDEESLIRFIKLGANDFVTKPFSKGEFTARLNHLASVYDQIQELTELSSKDYLTQLRSRKYFFEVATPYVYNAHKIQESCAVAMIDIDNFKIINDTYGHEVGDIVLKKLAKILHESLKGRDIVARYGGEEFCVLLRDTTNESAKIVFENLRQRVEEEVVKIIAVPRAIEIRFTISIGLSTDVRHSLEKMLSQADYWLYRAKGQGKNCVLSKEFYELEEVELV